MNATRWYKGTQQCSILIRGKRRGKRGPITYLVQLPKLGRKGYSLKEKWSQEIPTNHAYESGQ